MLSLTMMQYLLKTFALLSVTSAQNTFHIPRVSGSCVSVVPTSSSATANPSATCANFDWSQLNSNMLNSFTTYLDHNDNSNYDVYIGAVTVSGKIGDSNLNYQCPPSPYNVGNEGTQFDQNFGSECNTNINTQLILVHRNQADEKIYKIHVIRSGAPFETSLLANKGNYGMATYSFPNGIAPLTTGSLQICPTSGTPICPALDTSRVLDIRGAQNTDNGVYILGNNAPMDSAWV